MKRLSASGNHSLKDWFRAHRISTSIIPLSIILFGCLTGYIIYDGEQKAAAATREREKSNKEYDTLIKKIVAERKAREIAAAKKAAEDKARKLAAQKAAAAKSNNQPASSTACNTSKAHNNPARLDVIVNKRHCMMPLSFAPADLVTSYGATLRREAASQFALLVQAAQKGGVAISATSSYRSYAAQVATYQHWVSVNGSIAAADTVSARAGYSEHQTGLAVDVSSGSCSLDCFAGTPAYVWMKQNAHTYGFIERYQSGLTHITGYSPEAWHYRYVGVDVATAMKSSGVKTLEQQFGFSAAPSY